MSQDDQSIVALAKRYGNLEKDIHLLEQKNVAKLYTETKREMEQLDLQYKEEKAKYDKCVERTQKEKKDVQDMEAKKLIKEMFQNEDLYKKAWSKEQEEYLEAKFKEEIAKERLDNIGVVKRQLESELKEKKVESEKLQKCYEERDDILNGIFKGEYGSALENKLEAELDNWMERKQRISVAQYKWTNGRLLIHTSCQQLAFAVKTWEQLFAMRPQNLPPQQAYVPHALTPQQTQQQYEIATVAQKNVVAAAQNINSCQRYLSNITFPYCKPEEVDTLNKAAANIYIDVRTQERQQHAHMCYNITYRRNAALVQWFDRVISETINKDMEAAKRETNRLERELRQERVRLLKEKLEATGADTSELDNTLRDQTAQQEIEDDLCQKTETLGLVASDHQEDDRGVTPLPLAELAPPPSHDEICGNISELKKEYEQNMSEFQKAQDVNKARLEQGLQEKLAKRRARRQHQALY